MLSRTKLSFLNHGYNTTFLLSLACYVASQFFISLVFGTTEIRGFEFLLYGWMSFHPSWLANIVYVICSCLVIRRAKSLFWISFLLPILGALMFVIRPEIPNGQGEMLSLTHLGTGFWLWLIALLFMTLSCIILRLRNARKEPAYSKRFAS